MLGHHCLTIVLLSLARMFGFVRFGVVVLWLLDAADFLMQMTKAFKYARMKHAMELCFGVFAMTWIFTRHVMFPLLIYDAYVNRARDDGDIDRRVSVSPIVIFYNSALLTRCDRRALRRTGALGHLVGTPAIATVNEDRARMTPGTRTL